MTVSKRILKRHWQWYIDALWRFRSAIEEVLEIVPSFPIEEWIGGTSPERGSIFVAGVVQCTCRLDESISMD